MVEHSAACLAETQKYRRTNSVKQTIRWPTSGSTAALLRTASRPLACGPETATAAAVGQSPTARRRVAACHTGQSAAMVSHQMRTFVFAWQPCTIWSKHLQLASQLTGGEPVDAEQHQWAQHQQGQQHWPEPEVFCFHGWKVAGSKHHSAAGGRANGGGRQPPDSKGAPRRLPSGGPAGLGMPKGALAGLNVDSEGRLKPRFRRGAVVRMGAPLGRARQRLRLQMHRLNLEQAYGRERAAQEGMLSCCWAAGSCSPV